MEGILPRNRRSDGKRADDDDAAVLPYRHHHCFHHLVIFYMIVTHKNKDIGILKSVGAFNADVLELFLGLAAFIGIIGSAVGGLARHCLSCQHQRYRKLAFQAFRISALGQDYLRHRRHSE